jgi:hypothetical protein
MTDLDSILAKLASLKDLAERPGSAGEAAAATAAIQRLLFTHNLTMADVPNKGDEYIEQRFDVADLNAKAQRWKRDLLQVVAEANFCRIAWFRRSEFWKASDAVVVGREANVAVFLGLYEYLETEAKRQCRAAFKAAAAGWYADRAFFNQSFYCGFVETIHDRLQAQRKESTAEAGERGTALVVQAKRELDDAFARFFPITQTVKSKAIGVAASACDVGCDAGRNVNLDKQVSGSEQVALTG